MLKKTSATSDDVTKRGLTVLMLPIETTKSTFAFSISQMFGVGLQITLLGHVFIYPLVPLA